MTFVALAAADPIDNPYLELSPQRISEIATYLPDQPAGFGRPINDRAYWSDPAVLRRIADLADGADKLLTKKLPAWNDDAYLEFSRNGQRPAGEKMENARSAWLAPLALAECRENRGRFIAQLNQVLDAYAAEPTWTLPAHDGNLKCFHRQQYSVDLRTALFGHELAETVYLLDDKLDAGVKQRLTAALDQRLFQPFKAYILRNPGLRSWWLGSAMQPVQNNWNAVCLSGVVGGALAAIDDKSDRAVYVAAAEHYSQYFLNSFPDDGYCTEGVGYWNYGVSNFCVLREELVEATGGKIDVLEQPKVKAIAMYGVRFRIGPTAVPPFADCRFGTVASTKLLAYFSDSMNLGLGGKPFAEIPGGNALIDVLMPVTAMKQASGALPQVDPLRSFFDKAGVLCCRPAPGSSCQLGIGIKAGGNFSHSHNDVGSYEIAVGNDEPTGDPGGPKVYDASTFNTRRYTHKLINSYGHPVPVIAGQLQLDATRINPAVLSTHFAEDRDQITIDMKPAYAVTSLQSLTRTLAYSRTGAGEAIIIDDVQYSTQQTFEDAIVTDGEWKQVDEKALLLTMGNAKLQASIEAPVPFKLKAETITDLSTTFTRIGINLDQPVEKAELKITFRPAM